MQKIILVTFWLLACVLISCSEKRKDKTANDKQEGSCSAPVKDPNNPKPMALMMRNLADACDSMRLQILANHTVDSVKYPLMPFWTAEPTDSSVLEPLFFDNAKIIEKAWRTLMSSKENQAANYTAVVNACVHCHSSYCSGPLRRIRKLTLDYKPE